MRRLVALVVLLVVLVLAVTAFRVWYVAREDRRAHQQAIVVLGASQFNGRPSEVFRFRLLHAEALYRAGVAPRIITVGGNQQGDTYTEGSAGRNYLIQQGIPASATIAVGTGSDTLQSLQAVAKVMQADGWTTAVLVTDPWHELRSRAMASDQGLSVTTSPTRAGPAVRTRGTEIRYIARETLAYLYYITFHRSSDSGPRAV